MFGMNLENKAGAICTHSVRKTNKKNVEGDYLQKFHYLEKNSSKFIMYHCSILNNFCDF